MVGLGGAMAAGSERLGIVSGDRSQLRGGELLRGSDSAADLQALADEELLGRIDLGEELDPAGDFGGDAAAVSG